LFFVRFSPVTTSILLTRLSIHHKERPAWKRETAQGGDDEKHTEGGGNAQALHFIEIVYYVFWNQGDVLFFSQNTASGRVAPHPHDAPEGGGFPGGPP